MIDQKFIYATMGFTLSLAVSAFIASGPAPWWVGVLGGWATIVFVAIMDPSE